VTDVVLAVNYRPDAMTAALKKYEEEYNIKIHFSIESEPLGTAGPLKLAEKILGKDDSPFFVLNSDIICEYPFQKLADFHKKHGEEGTIVVTKVEEPSKYGVVVHSPNHPSRIDRFVEKPVEYVGNRINAGIYILNPSVLKRIELRPTSIEQETFPAICDDRQLHSFDLDGFWMDVGQPKDFLSGTCLYLNSLNKRNPKMLVSHDEPFVYGGNVMVHETAKIGKNCRIGPNVVVGPGCVIGDGVRLQRCVLLEDSKVKDHAWIKSTIVGWRSSVGRWARLENVTVLGDDVTIGDEIYVNGGSVLPHKSIKANVEGELPNLSFSDVRLLMRYSAIYHHVKHPTQHTIRHRQLSTLLFPIFQLTLCMAITAKCVTDDTHRDSGLSCGRKQAIDGKPSLLVIWAGEDLRSVILYLPLIARASCRFCARMEPRAGNAYQFRILPAECVAVLSTALAPSDLAEMQ
jgi:mannose-1-phosphate guanylyltransferase